LRSCVRPHMRASPSSYFFIGVLPSWLSAVVHFNFLPRRSSRHKQGTSLQTSHPAGRRPHHGPAFGTGELQEGGNHSIRRRLTRQAGQRRRPLGSVCPCRLTARVQFNSQSTYDNEESCTNIPGQFAGSGCNLALANLVAGDTRSNNSSLRPVERLL
jgi:hypothetical protein